MKRCLLLLTAILIFSSCASSRRLLRVFNEKTDNTNKEAERTNMFPLFYLSGTSSSFLWPLVDSDERGLSIRPIYNQEDDEYAFLFPLTAWNPVKNEGWIGPYHWDDEKAALFPLYYKDKDNLQFLTYYSYRNGSFLFPLYLNYKRSNGDGGFYTLLGGYSKDGNKTNSMAAMLWWSGSDPNSSYKTLFPLFYHGEGKNHETLYMFPWLSTKDSHSSTSMLFPLFLNYKEKNGDGGFYTLLGGHSTDGNRSNSMVAMLWWSGSGPRDSYKFLFPVFYHGKSDRSNSLYLFPWYSSVGDNHSSNFLFPLYSGSKRYNDKGELIKDEWKFPMLLPLAQKETTKNGYNTSVLYGAIFDHEVNGDKTTGDILLCLADWEKSPTTSRFRFPAIFNLRGLVDISEDEEKSKVNLLLYSHEKTEKHVRRDIFPFITWDSGENESGFSFLWRVFETHNRNGKKGGHIFFIPYGA